LTELAATFMAPPGGGEFLGSNALEQLEQPVVGEVMVNLQ
jgi:hypothetical protein